MRRSNSGRRRLRPEAGPMQCESNRRANRRRAKRSDTLSVHFSSKSCLWATPWDFFNKLDAEFGFTLDVCALHENAKCSRYFTPEEDGLKQDWRGVCWMNPPYGREIGKWVAGSNEVRQGNQPVLRFTESGGETNGDHGSTGGAPHVRGRAPD